MAAAGAVRLTRYANTPEAKHFLRSSLRRMRKTMLVSIDNFAIEEGS